MAAQHKPVHSGLTSSNLANTAEWNTWRSLGNHQRKTNEQTVCRQTRPSILTEASALLWWH